MRRKLPPPDQVSTVVRYQIDEAIIFHGGWCDATEAYARYSELVCGWAYLGGHVYSVAVAKAWLAVSQARRPDQIVRRPRS